MLRRRGRADIDVFIGHPKGIGIGDMIQWASTLMEWQLVNPGRKITLHYIEVGYCDVMFNLPGVDYVKVTQRPKETIDLFDSHLVRDAGRVRNVWSVMGLDWNFKRLWYFPTEQERAYGSYFWKTSDKTRVVVPWHNYGHWYNTSPVDTTGLVNLLQQGGCEVIVYDHDNLAPELGCAVWRHERMRSLRWFMGVLSHAHVFAGVSNFAFYASLGMGIPASGIFTTVSPRNLFMPVHTPKYYAHYAPGKPDAIPIERVYETAMEIKK
jgi:hypothetical protein